MPDGLLDEEIVEGEETRWTDARIRWPEDDDDAADNDNNGKKKNGRGGKYVDDDHSGGGDDDGGDHEDGDDDEDRAALQDPFKDANPMRTFDFHFSVQRREGGSGGGVNTNCDSSTNTTASSEHTTSIIDIEITGYKDDSDEVWESTGLTVWRAAKHLGYVRLFLCC
jgi:hypothetical protein